MLEIKTPAGPIYRLGRYPDPWIPPDWSHAQPDGTFGNRFDDPNACYRVLYASSQRSSCFIETLARFRPDLTLIRELQEIAGDDDFFPLSKVPKAWCEQRVLGTAKTWGDYADIYAVEWVGHLRRALSAECLKLGLNDLDVVALQQGQPRRLTQLASREVYRCGLSGIYTARGTVTTSTIGRSSSHSVFKSSPILKLFGPTIPTFSRRAKSLALRSGLESALSTRQPCEGIRQYRSHRIGALSVGAGDLRLRHVWNGG